ncbi:MAG: EF-hand domain-containing protein, partial [Verrucomicrobiales bacterium]|nr:EF-hand domain-containing protein [Verrucomicrobiales bacterium]
MNIPKTILPLSLLAAILMPIGTVFSQDKQAPQCPTCAGKEMGAKPRSHSGPGFADLDTNKDGKITEAEVIKIHQKRAEEQAKKHFAGMDLDENGFVTATEMNIISKLMSSHHNSQRRDDHRGHRERPHARPNPHGGHGFHGGPDKGKDDKRHSGSECKDGKCKTSECKDGKCKTSECKDGKCKAGECKDGKCKTSECKDGKC